ICYLFSELMNYPQAGGTRPGDTPSARPAISGEVRAGRLVVWAAGAPGRRADSVGAKRHGGSTSERGACRTIQAGWRVIARYPSSAWGVSIPSAVCGLVAIRSTFRPRMLNERTVFFDWLCPNSPQFSSLSQNIYVKKLHIICP